jgi:hypothetical protein
MITSKSRRLAHQQHELQTTAGMETAENARFFRNSATKLPQMATPNTGRFTESFHAIQARAPAVFVIV